MDDSYLDQMQAHVEADGTLTHRNGVELLGELRGARAVLARLWAVRPANWADEDDDPEQAAAWAACRQLVDPGDCAGDGLDARVVELAARAIYGVDEDINDEAAAGNPRLQAEFERAGLLERQPFETLSPRVQDAYRRRARAALMLEGAT